MTRRVDEVGKLWRVVVAGGAALLGAAGVARADPPSAGTGAHDEQAEHGNQTAPAAKGDQAKAPAKPKAAATKAPDKDAKAKEARSAEAKKAEEGEGGGVKGW